ncbi:MAG TPA: GIY-YIG nuclease family protein [Candidatus Binatus sp.]|nr:GIY-YIG nuclease family protein [Candidatus Binatus sp.]
MSLLSLVSFRAESAERESRLRSLCHSERSEESRLLKQYAKMVEQQALLRLYRYYVYIMSNLSRTLYAGVTNDLERRVNEHKSGIFDSFTKRYRVNRLVYFQETNDINEAIEAENRIKGISRSKKIALVEEENPSWRDLSAESEPVAAASEKTGILRRSGSE